jgi:hypothetical protein
MIIFNLRQRRHTCLSFKTVVGGDVFLYVLTTLRRQKILQVIKFLLPDFLIAEYTGAGPPLYAAITNNQCRIRHKDRAGILVAATVLLRRCVRSSFLREISNPGYGQFRINCQVLHGTTEKTALGSAQIQLPRGILIPPAIHSW